MEDDVTYGSAEGGRYYDSYREGEVPIDYHSYGEEVGNYFDSAPVAVTKKKKEKETRPQNAYCGVDDRKEAETEEESNSSSEDEDKDSESSDTSSSDYDSDGDDQRIAKKGDFTWREGSLFSSGSLPLHTTQPNAQNE